MEPSQTDDDLLADPDLEPTNWDKRAPPVTQLPQWLVIGFTGHRHLKENYQAAAAAIGREIDKLALCGSRIAGISSAASGGDTLFAEDILRRNAPLMVVLPFGYGRFQRDFEHEPPDAWDRARNVVSRATEVEVVHLPLADFATIHEDAPLEEQQELAHRIAEESYWEAGVRAIERSNVLLAVWDEKSGAGNGGTADAVQYARAIGMPVIIFNPESKQTTYERLGDFESADVPGRVEIREQVEFSVRREHDQREEGHARIESRARVANHERLQWDESPRDYREVVKRYYKHLDHVASHHGRATRNRIRLYVLAHLAASVLGATTVALGISGPISLLTGGFEFVVMAWVLHAYWRLHASHEHWLHRRVDAEVCRSFLKTWDIRRHHTQTHQPRPGVANVAPLFQSLRLLRTLDKSPIPSLAEARDKYLNTRVIKQIDYFNVKWKAAVTAYRRYNILSEACTIGTALASAVGLAIMIYRMFRSVGGVNHWTHGIEWLAMVLPLVASACGFMMATAEASRRKARYHELKIALERLRPVVAAAPTWEALARAATQVEEQLLQELAEWQSFVRFTEYGVHSLKILEKKRTHKEQ